MRPKHYAYFFLPCIALLALVGMSSCNTAKHNTKRQDNLMAKFDKLKAKADRDSVLMVVPPRFAHKHWPVRNKYIKGETKYVQGPVDTFTKHDTVKAKCPDGTTIYVPVESKHYNHHDTEKRTDSVYQIDSAQLRLLQLDVIAANKATVDLEGKLQHQVYLTQKATDRGDNWRTVSLWAIGAFLLVVIIDVLSLRFANSRSRGR